MKKSKRRQMVTTSIRNLVSHISAILYSNFRPVLDKREQPKHMATGSATCFIPIIEKVIGAHIKSIHPVYLLNEDYSSQYYYTGTSADSKNNLILHVQQKKHFLTETKWYLEKYQYIRYN